MKQYGFYGGLIILIAVNAIVLAGVWHNRSGTPDAAVELTERELTMSPIDKENSGVSLRLDWGGYGYRELKWFDRDKLAFVGFDCSIPVGSADAEIRYGKALSRKTFVVLEFEGKAWEAWQALELKRFEDMEAKIIKGEKARNDLSKAKKQFAWELVADSRLFPVDVGNDPKRLREMYPDRSRFIITPARVRLHYNGAVREYGKLMEPASLKGSIEEVLTDTVRVPRDKQGLLRSLASKDNYWRHNVYDEETNEKPKPPRYKVLLNYGRRYEPWVITVRSY
jgi:hypothetical protein